ncbi:uncharacterized protein TNCV_4297291 [Trichonephila clavipes]|nr:uncharacterized protein TNCV_4297291 [Trichonephila clavipes]
MGRILCLRLQWEDNGSFVKLSDCEVMKAQMRNLVKLSNCEVMESQLRNEESAPLIQGLENNANDDASDQEKASMQLVPWLVTLTAVPLGLSLNPGEDTDVCKRIVSSRYGGTLNSRRVASPVMRLVKGEESWEDPEYPQDVLFQNWGETEQNHSVTCMVLKATANNNRRHLALLHEEIHGPLSSLCRSGGISNNISGL